MKRIIRFAVLALVMPASMLISITSLAQYNNGNDDYYGNDRYDNRYDDRYGEDRDVTYQDFYDNLTPYGNWVEYPGYGYVWVPEVEEDFQPYSTNGHWVWTDNYEWMWVSDYDWGWAPFHYGRWEQDRYYGWFWVPGYEWSPAWVAWRDGGDYYGWAPLRPGINISINFNLGGYNPPSNYWCFVPRRHIVSNRWYDYCVPRYQNVTIINYTTVINYNYGGGYGFRSGPSRFQAERYCGRIEPVRFRQSYSPGRTVFRNNEINVYRPNVRREENRQFAPRQFDRYERNSGDFRNRTYREDRREMNNRNNNVPDRRDRIDDNGFRRNDNNRQQEMNNNRQDNRRFDRTNNDNRQPGNEQRIYRPSERNERTNNPGNNSNNRNFERRTNDNNNGNQPQRQREVRTFERNEQQQPQRQPQQMERRYEPQQQRQPQQPDGYRVERRSEQQQPSRQFERRDNGGSNNSGRNNGGGNNGNSNSSNSGRNRGRF